MTAIFRPRAQRIHIDNVESVLDSVRYDIEGRPEPSNAGNRPTLKGRAIRLMPGGYDVAQVDDLLNRAERAVLSGEVERARARQALRSTELHRRRLGYARGPVDSLIEALSRQLGIG
jgi:hypothetical protein